MELYKILQAGQKDVLAQGRADADTQLSHAEFTADAQLVFSAFQGLKSGADMGVQKLAFFSELYAPGGAGKELCAQGLLQSADGFADGRLADKQLFGGP